MSLDLNLLFVNRAKLNRVINRLVSIQKSVFPRSLGERDRVIQRNVLGSFVFQFFTNVLGLLVVPLSLSYIDSEKYGIWLNASVIVTWLQNMNFGMGFGMQNKVSEALAKGENDKAKDYVTIVYHYTGFIALGILLFFLLGSFFIDWNGLFNSSISSPELFSVFLIALLCFLFYFVLGNIASLFNAIKQTWIPKLFGFITNILTVIFLFSIGRFSHNSLVMATLALALPTPLVYAVSNLYFFNKSSLKPLRPSLRIKDKDHVKDVFSLGIRFFILQLTTLFISQAGVFIITQYLGPVEATPYSIINRYFFFVFFIFALVVNSYWPGFTEAYFKKDYNWLRKSFRKLILFGIGGTVAIICLYVLSFILIPIWSKNAFDIHAYKALLFTSALYTVTLFFSSIISVFLSALNLLEQQMIIQIIMAFVSVGLSILLIGYFHWGSYAINVAILVSQAIYILVCGAQVYRFFVLLEKQTNVSLIVNDDK